MSNSFFALIFRQRYIRRWGLMRNTNDENLAEHSAQVAMIAHALAVLGNARLGKAYDPAAVCVYALYHDATEVYTGDLPTPVKYYTPEMRENYRKIEDHALDALIAHLPDDLTDGYREILEIPDPDVHRLVKAADKLCAYIKCVEELKAGNAEFSDAAKTTLSALKDTDCSELKLFMDEFLPSFSMTLDEMQK